MNDIQKIHLNRAHIKEIYESLAQIVATPKKKNYFPFMMFHKLFHTKILSHTHYRMLPLKMKDETHYLHSKTGYHLLIVSTIFNN